MRKEKGKYLINRNRYKDIKKYDHHQMETFLTSVYESGYKDGMKETPGVELDDVYAELDQIKGIGPKTSEKIKAAIEPLFNKGREAHV